jgi:hypothetical protein
MTWDSLCLLLLEYLGLTETQQQAARLAFGKYKSANDQSVKGYMEHSNHLASQLPEDYSQAERAWTYIVNLKPTIKRHLPLYHFPRPLKDATEMTLHIKNNAELLGGRTALANAMAKGSLGDRARSSSPTKREVLPLRDKCNWNDDCSKQQT